MRLIIIRVLSVSLVLYSCFVFASNSFDKTELVCRRWILRAVAKPGERPEFVQSYKYYPYRYTFRKDSSFEEEQNFYGPVIENGSWNFNADSTSIIILLRSVHGPGVNMEYDSLKVKPKIEKIIRLNIDTLVLDVPDWGELYFIPEN